MISHPMLIAHPNVEKILIFGRTSDQGTFLKNYQGQRESKPLKLLTSFFSTLLRNY